MGYGIFVEGFLVDGVLVENFGRKDYWSTGIFVEGKLVERIFGRTDYWSNRLLAISINMVTTIKYF